MRCHTKIRLYKCSWPGCESTFAIKCNLEDHKKLHTDDKMFVCDIAGCSRRFIQNSHLRKHKIVHQDEKKFACDWIGCFYRSHRQHDLNMHKTIHTGDKRFSCLNDFCTKTFSRSNLLKRHLQNCNSKDQLLNNQNGFLPYSTSTNNDELIELD